MCGKGHRKRGRRVRREFGSVFTEASDRDLAHNGTAVDFRHIIRAYGRAFDRFMIPASALSGQQV